MENFRNQIRRLIYGVLALSSAILVVIVGLIVYVTHPEVFNTKELAVETASEWRPKDPIKEMAIANMPDDVKYGYDLLTETPKFLGPEVADSEMRSTGNNLACKNCHLKTGTQVGAASWIGVTQRFPSFRGRSNSIGTIEDRINGCFERSMNGKKLPVDSKEMQAMKAYMEWLGEDMPEERIKEYKGFVSLKIPAEAVDLEQGKSIYTMECALCHGANGQGVKFPDGTMGYQYPPLWGQDSYNDGAGMHRVLTAAQFIKANMPFGQATKDRPKLTDEEAYHVAGYINNFMRPEKRNKTKDFPDRKLKPVSTPYGPWDDNFSAEQHKFGPFPPIIAYYKNKYNIKKTK
ncbi:c-type cytochrome [Maribacter thermophilus]|uniref:c-type cytochrome n=1 Tax=Maribacter thermophilus TaxID=1197874 RepID=UPI0006412D48|nr:c-type cytochrome [Maribacter thermophilus]